MAKRYGKILLAVDFHEDNQVVIETACELKDLYEAELHLVHVNEFPGVAYAAEGAGWGDRFYALESDIRKESRQKMSELAGSLGLDDTQCHLPDGRPSTCIHELCEEQGFDLIILGTHGQAGLQLLLGSTANAVLHGSSCDVLAVRIR